MRAEKNSKAKPPQKTGKRILILILALAGIFILSVVFIVPAFISSEKGGKIILARINDSIDGRMDFSDLSMGWLKGIRITDFSFSDSTGRTSVKIKQITAKPHYGSILMGSLSFGKTIIDEPEVEINLKHPQAEKTGTPPQEVSTGEKPQTLVLPIKKIDLVINKGNLKVTDSRAAAVKLSQINSRVNLRPPGRQTNFDINMAVVDRGKESKVHVDGQITPRATKTGWTLEGSSGKLTVEVDDLDLGSLGPIFVLAGVELQAKGSVSANINSSIKDGRVESLSGSIKGKNLDVEIPQLKGDRLKTSTLDVAIQLTSNEEVINIENLQIQTDWLTAQARGIVPTTFKSLAEFTKVDSKYDLKGSFKCDVAAAISQMPRTFGIKEGTKVTSGQLTGNIETYTRQGKRKILGQANLAGLQGIVGGKAISLSQPVRAEVEITSDKAGIKYDKLDASAAFGKIRGSGTSELLEYDAELDLTKLQSEFGQFADLGPYKIAGQVFSKGRVSAQESEIAVVGSSVVKNLRLSSADGLSASEPAADVAFSLTIVPANNIVNIELVEAKAGLGQLSVKNAVLPLNEKATRPMNLPMYVHIDLQKLRPFAVLFTSFPEEMQLSGIAKSQINITSEQDSYYIKTEATSITNLRLIYPGKEPFEQESVSLVAEAQFNSAAKTYAVKWQLVSPQIKIKGDFKKTIEGNNTRLEGQADCEYDWAAISAVAAPFLPKGLRLQGQREDTISFAAEYPTEQPDKLLANLNTKARVGFARADYMGLVFESTQLDVQIRDGLLEIAPFSTKVNNGQFNFAGDADFKQKPVLLKTPGPIQIAKDIQINDQTTRQLLKYVNPVFANAVNVSGTANFHCERLAIPLAGATKNDAEVIGTVSITNLRLQASDLLGQILSAAGATLRGQDITIHPTRFVLQDGFLKYDDMQMDIGDNPVVFSGVIGLDKSLDMRVTLPYTTRGRTVRLGRETAGERISLPLRGTIDKPELDLGKLLEEQLKGQLEDELRKGLEKIFK